MCHHCLKSIEVQMLGGSRGVGMVNMLCAAMISAVKVSLSPPDN